MSLDLSIANALSGLNVVQRSIDTVSQNITNAQTPGYTRKTLSQEAVVIGGTGTGVRGGELERVVDTSLQADLRRRLGTLTGLEVKEAYLQRVEELQGRPEDETSLASTFGTFQDAFEKLSSMPESASYQLSVVSAATSLTDQLHAMSSQMTDLRNQTQNDIVGSVDVINGHLKRIADLNKQIVGEAQAGHSIANLEDLRDQSMLELSKYIDIQAVRSNDHHMIITTRNGEMLVDRTAQQLEFSAVRLDPTSYYSSNQTGDLSGIMIKGSPPRDVTGALGGGKLGALIELRDKTFPVLQGQLDEFAHKMATRFKAAGMTLFTDIPGKSPQVPPDNPGAYVGFAASITVNPATTSPDFVRYGDAGDPAKLPPPAPGDPPHQSITNQRILYVVNHAFGEFANTSNAPHAQFRNAYIGPDARAGLTSDLPQNASLATFVQTLVARQGQLRAEVSVEKTRTEELKNAVEARSSDLSGVNLDTEMAHLTILQRSYSASAQVLRTAQQMLDTLFAAAR